AYPGSGTAVAMERQQSRRGAQGAGARRRYRGGSSRTRKPAISHQQGRTEARMTKLRDIYPGDRVILREVGLRDGLQLVKKLPSTEAKQRWGRDEYAAGG